MKENVKNKIKYKFNRGSNMYIGRYNIYIFFIWKRFIIQSSCWLSLNFFYSLKSTYIAHHTIHFRIFQFITRIVSTPPTFLPFLMNISKIKKKKKKKLFFSGAWHFYYGSSIWNPLDCLAYIMCIEGI